MNDAGENVLATPKRRGLSGVGRVWLLNAFLGVLALEVYVAGPSRLPSPRSPLHLGWWVFALLFGASEVCVVHIQFRRDAHSFSLSEVALVLGLFFTSPGQLVMAQLIGATLALAIHRRQSPIKLVFNVANFTLQAGIATTIFFKFAPAGPAVGPRMWGAAFAATGFAGVISILTIFLAISLSQGKTEFKKFRQALLMGSIVTVTNTSLGLVGATLVWQSQLAGVLLALPAATLFLAYRAYVSEREQHESLELLFESSRAISGAPETESALMALLGQARKMFRADYAEILLFSDANQVLRTTLGPEDLVVATHPIRQDLDPGSLQVRAVAEGRPVLITHTDLSEHAVPGVSVKDAMAAPLHGETKIIGVLIVANRLGDVSTFDREDLRLFDTFVHHASMALENGRLEKSLAQLTELKEQLRFQAFHDPLTNLANRILFTERVEHAVARGGGASRPVSILFLDLDNFKNVNDSLGHAAGDELLRRVSSRIADALRPGDTAARLGGDEFAVLLEGTSESDAVRVAGRIVGALRSPIPLGGSEVFVQASLGISCGRSAHCSAEELLRNADVAMYVAKAQGKGTLAVFEPSMHATVLARMELERDLRGATARREFEIHYQPIVDIERSDIVGMEALARWSRGDGGWTSPSEFIPVAEATGDIVSIGRWVLETACLQAAKWYHTGKVAHDFVTSVNLSVRQLQDPSLVPDVARVLRETGLPPSCLSLEVTESAVMVNLDATIDTLTALRAHGVRIAIDDFGTGYSSLSYLKQLPVDTLKIDRSFVDGIDLTPQGAALVRAIMHLGEALSLDVIAEGIETEAQFRALRQMRCKKGQGFAIAKPLPAHDMEELLLPAGRRLFAEAV